MMKWNSIFLSKKATLILVIIVEKESFMSAIPIQKTLSKEELYTLIQNYQKNHDQKSKEMIITKIDTIYIFSKEEYLSMVDDAITKLNNLLTFKLKRDNNKIILG